MLRLRPLAVLLSLAVALCLLGLWSVRSQTGALRRVTNTTRDGVNVNPSISGDGRRISFESTKDLAGAGGNGFHALRADISSDPATFIQMGVTRAPAAGISQDGSSIAFASKDDPLGTNADGNSEIFLYAGTTLRQITNTTPSSPAERTRQGNFQPSLTDDGRFIAFSSNRNLANQNPDGNLEIFIFDTSSSAFTQLTNTSGAVGATDAKISGDATRVAYIRDTNASPATQRDLVLQERVSGATRILAAQVTNLAFTYGRAISDDGLRVVYSGDTATNSSQVFLFDGRTTNTTRQVTTLGVRETEVPLHPTISGDGKRIAFATRRPMPVVDTDSDNSIDLFTYDIPTGQFARVTDAPSVADGFDGSNRAAEVVSSLSDDGSVIAFNFPRSLIDDVETDFDNNSEIYVTGTAVRPTVGTLTVLNGASFGHEPETTEAVAPDSIAVARGGALSFTTVRTQRQADGTFPRTAGGTTVTVNGRSAQIFFVSPEQVNFHVPAETELGIAEVVVTNVEGFQSRGTIQVLRAAPGIFTTSGDGVGEGMILNADTLQPGPFDPSGGNLRLVIFATGVRKASVVTATAGGRALTVESVMETPNMPGMDEVRVLVPADLRGAGMVDLMIRADGRDSNPVTVVFTGPCGEIVINEVLADPPDGLAGDANRDGVRDSGDDEFVELVNRTDHDINIGGYQLTARSTSSSTDTVRHTFAAGTIFTSGTAIVIFGGGNPNPSDPAFGGALVLKASSGGLSLTNSGGVITLRQPSQAIVNIFSYGGSTGLNGDANQSLTRSPDAEVNSTCESFRLHSTAPNSGGRLFSPGTRVNGTPFTATAIARIEVLPATAAIDNGAKQQFTATAYDANGSVIPGVIFFWQSSNTSVATIDQTGLATSVSPGMTEIRASARGVQSAPAVLTVRDVVRVLTTVEVTPSSATIPVGGTQQFTARGLDQFGNEITGLTFTWESTNTNVATIDQTGVATGVSQGQTTIRATSQGVTGTATLNVTPPTVVINEVLADPPGSTATDLQGDANHDGTRSGTDDEFVELVNSTGGAINISGWTLRTRATGGTTETLRHTFAANTTLPASEAIVVFGGGNPDPANAAFACAQVVKASTSGLSLTNSGLTVIIRDSAGNLVAQFTYGTGTSLAADNDQSLTRSPDITGNFVQHLAAAGAGTRRFSPGTRTNGTPFGACPSRLTSVTISPPSASVVIGQTTQFTAQAFDQFGQPMTGVTITFASDNTTAATVDSVTTDTNTGIATATVTGRNAGTAHITAQATDGTTTVTSNQATLTVNSATQTYVITGQVRDGSNNPLSDVLITFEKNFQGTLTTQTTTTDANGNYSSGDLGCQNNVKVTPSKTGFVFTPSSISFVNSSQCLTGTDTANFTGAAPPPGTLVISQLYVAGGNANATYTHDFVEIFNSGTTTVDFSVTPYSIQFVGTGASFGSTSASNKTNITSGTIAPGQYFLVQEASGGAVGVALPTPDATGSINLLSAGGKVALVVGTNALPALTCPGDDGASPFNPSNSTIADFVGYGGNANTAGHCYEGPAPAAAPNSTNADFRKAGGCVDTNFNADDFLVAAPNPRNTSSPVNDCSAGLKPEITINDPASVSESTANATFTVTLSVPSTLTVTVDYATANNTAAAGADYQSTSGTLTFAPGETVKNILVPIINDTMDEPSETFFVNLSNATNGVILDSQGQGTITDNDAQPTLSINDTSIAEGDTGATNATFTVSLSTASGFTVTVNYATADNTATAGSDYQSTSGQLTFNPGQTTQTINVPVNGDTTFEADETFFVNLTTPANATIADNQGQGTITNDDAAPPIPAVTINDVSVTEGDSGTKTVDFTVSLSMNPTQTVTVDYTTASAAPASGVATAGTDYQPTSGTLTFNPGETSKPITVTINGDTLVEPDETFFVNLSNAQNATITDSQGVGTITNDDTASLVISQVYGGGNNSGAPYQRDFIELFNRGTTTVDFSVTNYSVQYASAGANFGSSKTDLTSGTIAPGHYYLIQESGGTTNGVPLPTPDATGSINLVATAGKVALVAGTAPLAAAICPGDDGIAPFNPSDATIADFVGYGSVVCYEGSNPAPAPSNTTADFRKAGGCTDTNDNAADFFVFAPNPRNSASPANNCSAGVAPNLTINDVTVTEGNSGTVTATFTVSLSAPANGADVTFDIATANGTATTANNDYVAKSLTNQIIPAGQQTYTFSVTINGDTTVEPDETFFVNVTNVAGANVTDGQGTGTIQNDDLPALTINDVTQNEGNGATTFTFTVSLSAPAPAAVTFDIATADGTAQDGTPSGEDNDYIARSLTGQSIAAGQQTFTFDVTVNGDTTVEPNETFFVNVTNISGATAGDTQGLGTIQNDDSPPSPIVASVVVTPSPVTINRGQTQQFTATAFDPSNQPVPSATFTWSSSNTAVATVDNNGLATGVGIGTTTITATTSDGTGGNVSGTATLTVQVPLVINEILADVPPDNVATTNVVEGDANRDGVRSSDDDEFVELLNNSSSPVDISGVVISDSTSNRFTFPANTTLAAGRAVVIFGGGSPPVNDPAFGGSLILTTSSLGLNDSGSPADTVTVKLNVGGTDVAIASVTYGGAGNAPAPSDQSLTRSPDAEINSAGGNFVAHNTATNAAGRVFSPGTRADGTPFGSPAITRIEVLPASASINIGATQLFTATAYSNVGGPEVVVPNVSFTWDSSDTTKATVAPTTGASTTATGVAAGSSTIRAQAGGQQGTAALTINAPLTLSINDVTHNEGNGGPTTYTFTVSLSAIAPATVTFDIATQDDTATVADSDYVAKSLTGQSIPAGQQTYTFDVTVNGDINVEPNETFFVNVTNVSGATTTDGQGVGTIQNDDSAPAPEANLSITKTDSPDPVPSGANLTYTLTVTNNSATTTAQSVTVTDNLPADVVFVSCTSVSGNGTCGGTGNNRTVTFTSIAGNTSETITLVARVLHSAAGTTISNTASVSATTTDPDTSNNSATQATVVTLPPLAISYVYGGGGANTGTPSYTRDFVEIFNRGTVAITLSGLSLQQGASTGNIGGASNQIYALCPGGAATCTLNPGQHYLVETGALGTAGASLSATVTPDDATPTGTLSFAATNGKAALVIGTTGLACGATATLCSATQLARVVDLVGYGTGTTQAEGNSPTGNLSTTTAARRKANGCTDTNVNSADFDIITPTGANAPRNMASALNVCP